MTAPGQEPDEVMTAQPGGEDGAAEPPDLDAIGDNHMPDDLRRAQLAKSPSGGGRADSGSGDSGEDDSGEDGSGSGDNGEDARDLDQSGH